MWRRQRRGWRWWSRGDIGDDYGRTCHMITLAWLTDIHLEHVSPSGVYDLCRTITDLEPDSE